MLFPGVSTPVSRVRRFGARGARVLSFSVFALPLAAGTWTGLDEVGAVLVRGDGVERAVDAPAVGEYLCVFPEPTSLLRCWLFLTVLCAAGRHGNAQHAPSLLAHSTANATLLSTGQPTSSRLQKCAVILSPPFGSMLWPL